MEQNMPAIGPIVESYFQEKRTYKAALARALNTSPQQISRIRNQNDMYISRLWQLSHVLKHNFIADIAFMLPAEFTGALADTATQKDQEIMALRNELAAMTKERDIYKDLLNK